MKLEYNREQIKWEENETNWGQNLNIEENNVGLQCRGLDSRTSYHVHTGARA